MGAWTAYFVPFETDKTIIDCQFQAIVANKLRQSGNCSIFNSFLYFVAVVQISHCIFDSNEKKRKYDAIMLKNVLTQFHKSVIIDVINCEYERMHSLVIEDGDNCLEQLKNFMQCGKERIENKERIKILKRDFLS